MMLTKWKKYRETIYFGLALASLFFLIKWLETKYILFSYDLHFYIMILAMLFTGLGIWISRRLSKPQKETIIVEKEILIDSSRPFEINSEELQRRKISKRELEVLELIASGKSNQEIADTLFVSVATVKTHTSNLLDKLDARRRTQAIENAKKLRLLRSY